MKKTNKNVLFSKTNKGNTLVCTAEQDVQVQNMPSANTGSGKDTCSTYSEGSTGRCPSAWLLHLLWLSSHSLDLCSTSINLRDSVILRNLRKPAALSFPCSRGTPGVVSCEHLFFSVDAQSNEVATDRLTRTDSCSEGPVTWNR